MRLVSHLLLLAALRFCIPAVYEALKNLNIAMPIPTFKLGSTWSDSPVNHKVAPKSKSNKAFLSDHKTVGTIGDIEYLASVELDKGRYLSDGFIETHGIGALLRASQPHIKPRRHSKTKFRTSTKNNVRKKQPLRISRKVAHNDVEEIS